MPKNTRNRTRNRKKSNLGSPVSINLPQGAIKEAGDSLVNIQRQSAEIMGPALRIVRNVVLVGVVGGVTYFGVRSYLKNKAQSDIYTKMVAGDKAAEAAIAFAMLLDKNKIQQLLDMVTGNITSAVESVKDSLFINTIMGPADSVANLFSGLGISELSQKLNFIAGKIFLNQIDTKQVQKYFFQYTGGRYLYKRVPMLVKQKETALFFEYLTGKRRLTAEQAAVNPNTGELPEAGHSAIVSNIEGKIAVMKKSGYLWNKNIMSNSVLPGYAFKAGTYSLLEFFTNVQRELFYVRYGQRGKIEEYVTSQKSPFVAPMGVPIGLTNGLVYNRDQWGWKNENFYEIVSYGANGTGGKKTFYVLKSDVTLFEDVGLAKSLVTDEKYYPLLNNFGKLQEQVANGKFSLSGIPKEAQRSVLSLPLFGL